MLPRNEYLGSLPCKRVIASALLVAPDRRVLCVEPTYKTTWHLPGGTVEHGESPSEACRRECSEELGILIELGRLLAVGHLEPSEGDPVGALAFIYDASMGGQTDEDLVLARDEIRSAAWLSEPEMHSRLSTLSLRFVSAGLQARERSVLVEFDRSFPSADAR